ncbi:hypothetical protein ACHAXR_009370, partial [Thalassiosira sp. AJA248-18]
KLDTLLYLQLSAATLPMIMMNPSLKYVDHTYQDLSCFIEEGGELIKHKKSGNNFPARLHKILSEPTYSDIITWMPHGRAWKLLDKERLISEVIPNYYVFKKYESFPRQLNAWGKLHTSSFYYIFTAYLMSAHNSKFCRHPGFKRLHQTGCDSGCYYHECFLRDLPKLTCFIRRLPSNIGKSHPFPEGEPNFYRISEEFPLPPTHRNCSASSELSISLEADPSQTCAGSFLSEADTPNVQHLSTGEESFDTARPIETTLSSTLGGAPGSFPCYSSNNYQAGAGYYYPPSNHIYSAQDRMPCWTSLLPPSYNGTDQCGNSYTIPGQHFPQLQYQLFPSAPNEPYLPQSSYSQEPYFGFNASAGNNSGDFPLMASRDLLVTSSSAAHCITHQKSDSCSAAQPSSGQEQNLHEQIPMSRVHSPMFQFDNGQKRAS